MFEQINSNDLELDALYLGILTARKVKPLSRLEYPVKLCIIDAIKKMGLIFEPVTRLARNGNHVKHWIMGKDRSLFDQYQVDFDGKLLEGNKEQLIRSEASYFGYPVCCAENYINSPYAPNKLMINDQRLLFHYACPDCEETPRLIPLYKAALEEAEELFEELQNMHYSKVGCTSQYFSFNSLTGKKI